MVGLNYFEIADRAVGTAFLRPSAKMAAQCSSCGRAPPRPGCLLKTQAKALEARHSKPPVCPEPSSAQPKLAQARSSAEPSGFLTHRELGLLVRSQIHRITFQNPISHQLISGGLFVFLPLSYRDHFFTS